MPCARKNSISCKTFQCEVTYLNSPLHMAPMIWKLRYLSEASKDHDCRGLHIAFCKLSGVMSKLLLAMDGLGWAGIVGSRV